MASPRRGDVGAIAARLGHSEKMAETVYGGIPPEQHAVAADALERVLGSA
ncbi:hypothetical protein Val02_02650 [Virgisporangium aliadipatigenens]|uniref:Integrase n=1 Tax=Virgisporangium aliadipatigenens TaxID=741659 RepID=A0A8J3YDZ8_9ACTN|nr:hypothetical protein [Virgisporangium aliadipatigenens]GIJ43379.1 hypothetical protein Val02_02650 [Virgisporangium aliadipatigenens]